MTKQEVYQRITEAAGLFGFRTENDRYGFRIIDAGRLVSHLGDRAVECDMVYRKYYGNGKEE